MQCDVIFSDLFILSYGPAMVSMGIIMHLRNSFNSYLVFREQKDADTIKDNDVFIKNFNALI
jgi:hypothetical protein